MRLLAFCVTWIGLNGLSCAEEIKIGVRTDAKPFSYCKPTQTKSGCAEGLDKYDGYSISICKNVLDDMRLRNPDLAVKVVNVTAGDRFQKLQNRDVDFLCGADTITEERLNDYAFSVPIYVTGISIAWRRRETDNRGCHASGTSRTAVVGMVGNTTAQSYGVDLMLREGEFGQFEKTVRRAMSADGKDKCSEDNSVDKSVDNLEGKSTEIIKIYADHEEGLRKFCDGEVKYYIADREILLFATQCSDISVSGRTYSHDLYGLVFRKPSSGNASDYRLFAEISYSLQRLSWGPRSILIESALSKMNGYRLSPELQQFYRSVAGVGVPNYP
jgi:ABC-type amino acid transport substrate-binding protein